MIACGLDTCGRLLVMAWVTWAYHVVWKVRPLGAELYPTLMSFWPQILPMRIVQTLSTT